VRSVRRLRGFTLIEVLVATMVMSLISVGALATVWRLAGFAREQAEMLAADDYCHDVLWRFFNADDLALAQHGTKTYKVPLNVLPVIIRDKTDGTQEVTSLLWRDTNDSSLQPTCRVSVEPCDASGGTVLSGFDVASNALITVSLKWGRSDDVDRQNTIKVVRAGRIDRWQNVTQ